jgi:hypothetical protein
MVCVTDATAPTLAPFQLAHRPAGFTALHTQMAPPPVDPAAGRVALETTRGRGVDDLRCQGDPREALNPKAVYRDHDRHVLSAANDDRLAALALAHLLRTDRHRCTPLVPPPEPDRRLDRVGVDWRTRLEEQTRVSHHMTAGLSSTLSILDSKRTAR